MKVLRMVSEQEAIEAERKWGLKLRAGLRCPRCGHEDSGDNWMWTRSALLVISVEHIPCKTPFNVIVH